MNTFSRHAIVPDETAAVDMVVVDTDDFVPDATSRVRFGQLEHHALIEAKWFQRGFWSSSGVRVYQDAVRQARASREPGVHTRPS